MYQISTEKKWDTEYYHELMDKRIISSKKAKEIRDELSRAGALPYFDNNYDYEKNFSYYLIDNKMIEEIQSNQLVEEFLNN